MCTDVQEGNVRLVDGPSAYEGRVEICHSKQWGTICNRYWDNLEAKVVCRQLGFTAAGIYYDIIKIQYSNSVSFIDNLCRSCIC